MPKENVVRPGKSRLGWLYDGSDETPHLAVMLQDTGERIELHVPLRGMGINDQYSRWFGQNINYGDDPDRTRYDYQPPKNLLFVDEEGHVALVGCRADGFKQASVGAGVGYIIPNYAVLGGTNLKYDRLNGLRTEIPGLSKWTGLTSREVSWKTDDKGLIKRANVTLESPPAIRLSRKMNLTLEPAWSTSSPEPEGTLASHDIVFLETRTKRPRSWHDHLYPHLRVRELLLISAWYPFGFSQVLANRTDDPERVLSGKAVHERWSETATHALPKHLLEQQPRFLFTFKDIGGASGVRRWLRLRARFQKAIQPLIAVRDQRSFIETQILQTGAALEALGHGLGVEDGKSPTHRVGYRRALNRIISDLKHNPLPDTDDWKDRSQESYLAVKHPDREVPDVLVLANTLRENLLVTRLWVAGRLGVKPATLEQRLSLDPHSKVFTEGE